MNIAQLTDEQLDLAIRRLVHSSKHTLLNFLMLEQWNRFSRKQHMILLAL
jgi:hypothetical protein